jgi:hypothetical protein
MQSSDSNGLMDNGIAPRSVAEFALMWNEDS